MSVLRFTSRARFCLNMFQRSLSSSTDLRSSGMPLVVGLYGVFASLSVRSFWLRSALQPRLSRNMLAFWVRSPLGYCFVNPWWSQLSEARGEWLGENNGSEIATKRVQHRAFRSRLACEVMARTLFDLSRAWKCSCCHKR